VFRILLFAVLSAVLAYVSRGSLAHLRYHGFHRFLAWEFILALFLINFISVEQWFGDPFSLRQVCSAFLLTASIIPAILGLRDLRAMGRPDSKSSDDRSLFSIEKTTRLVTTGVYRHVRHPVYSSLLLLAWGVFLKKPSWSATVLALCATAALIVTAKIEEAENCLRFGDEYRAYRRHTKMFVPFVF